MTDHLLISLEFSLFFILYFFISLLGGLSMTDHLLISLEFSLFFILYFFISLLGGLSTTDHLLISLEFSLFFLYSLFFIYFYFFRTLFCTHVYSKLPWSISFKFLSVIKPYSFKSNQLFQGH